MHPESRLAHTGTRVANSGHEGAIAISRMHEDSEETSTVAYGRLEVTFPNRRGFTKLLSVPSVEDFWECRDDL